MQYNMAMLCGRDSVSPEDAITMPEAAPPIVIAGVAAASWMSVFEVVVTGSAPEVAD